MTESSIKKVFRHHWMFWGIAVVLALDLGARLFVLGPQREKIIELHQRYVTLRKPRILQKSEPFGWVLQAEKDISTFKHMLAGSSEFPNVVSEIFNALHSRGLPVEKMSYSHAPAGKGNLNLVKYTTTLSTSGPYSELKAFLADILDSGRLLYIENLTLVNRSKRKESVALNIVLSTFFFLLFR
ncbi:MAG: type 4a pilus biogenesis protein PilO [Deltaproteobacteria bacterium]|nr:type 4a pilus biogenesis protein PilO [Deltaproteobacteria bacterium]